uniref:helix-turn-helix domain-containing protein n=2 Tax=Bacteroidaceae TaxID=815 RepID=UPI003AB626F6
IEQVATQFGLSARSLTRIFTNSNIRFLHYLNYQRVVRAIEIMSDGAMNIEQTAYEVGFNSPNSFSRVFKQITGESPSGYFRK